MGAHKNDCPMLFVSVGVAGGERKFCIEFVRGKGTAQSEGESKSERESVAHIMHKSFAANEEGAAGPEPGPHTKTKLRASCN